MNTRAHLCGIFLLVAGAVWGQTPQQLWAQATVYRDSWGVPHVYADTPRALAFAFGYAQAEDRLETLMRAYRIATGRAAAVFGPDYADSDAFALKMGHGDLAVQALEDAPPLTLDLCEGFALGVNAWIADHPGRVPEWVDGARPADVLALMHCYLMSFAPFDLRGIFSRPAPAFSGNAWALGPPLTQSGAPVLVINPHGYYDGPFQWYEAHLAGPRMNVAGAGLCGLPVILQGHNEVLGWALTPNYPDFADIYVHPKEVIKLPPADPNKMQLEAALERLLIGRRLAEARIFFVNTPSGMRQRSVSFRLTGKGPVVGEIQGDPCSFFAGGYADFGALEQLASMAAARNLGEFQDALAMRQLPCFHVLYADREGNLFYLYNAKVGDKALAPATAPRGGLDSNQEMLNAERGAPPDTPIYGWDEPVPAQDFRYFWGQLVPIEALPAVVNPPAGYLQACGTPPWEVTGNSGINPATVPLWLANDRDSFRAQRVRHLLSFGKRSFQEAQSMVYDVLVPFATAAVPQLLAWADARENFLQTAHPDTGHGLDVLRSWNFVAETNSSGMTLFNAWWTAYRQLAGPDASDALLYQEFMSATPRVQELALEAVSNAAREMRNLHDAIEVPWGDVHRLRRGNHEEPIPGGLAGEPIMVTGGYGGARRKLLAGYGYAFAMAVQFGDVPESVSVSPGGASDDPASEHFADQLSLFAERRFKINYFLDKDVQRYAESALGRCPTLRPVGMQGVFGINARDPVSVHLETAAESPAPLPDGMAPYTVFVTPKLKGPGVPASVDAAIYIPPSVVQEGGLEQLAVYTLDPEHGWFAAPNQAINANTRILHARYQGLPTCVVLGPAVLRVEPPVLAAEPPSPEETPREQERLQVAAEPDIEPAPEEAPVPEMPAAPAPESPEVSEAGLEAPQPGTLAQAPVIPAPAQGPSTPADAVRSALAWGKTLEIPVPGGAGSVSVTANKSVGVFTSASGVAPVPPPEGLDPATPFVAVHCSDAEASMTLEVALSVPGEITNRGEALGLYGYRPETGWQKLPEQRVDKETGVMTGSDTRPGIYAVLKPAGAPEAQAAPLETTVAAPAQDVSIETTPAPVETPPEEQARAPEPAAAPVPAGPRKPTLAWGKSLVLAAQNARAEFTIEAESSIGAFTKVLAEPPGPIPEGMQAYGSFVDLSLSKQDVPLRIGLALRPEQSLPDGVDIGTLAIYAFNPDAGWERLEGQQLDQAAGALTGSDTQARTYVILGPKK
ncbi:MAG TPA: penicillin acylase family protein [Candidatus Hydrogenedentes bacterium]|mgnify:CR=1 FL=1|nr:penicillin acylase family protein [Candidatus Hydrogenedentota bacterium]HQE82387.1 penicillin acylase family protein [Candidatus Hydrogenedentota bacterium]HQH69362.1 penicillin acylase family protein [Candidatus Hydrogenedentota bacterium]HQM49562.1 penicillin acylase family protein [Candidatus Hydrogenedentota bacterium]